MSDDDRFRPMTAHELARLLLELPDLPIATHASNHTAYGKSERQVVARLATYQGEFIAIGNFTLENVSNGNARVVEFYKR